MTPTTAPHGGRRLAVGVRALTVCATLALLTACSGKHGNTSVATASDARSTAAAATASTAAPTAKPHAPRFISKHWGFTIAYPAGWQLHRDFRHSYLQSGQWKTYAAPTSNGMPVIAMTLPGSNRVTDAEVRIGVSNSTTEVARCTKPPQTVRTNSIGDVTINGIQFSYFEAGDAAMSHYLDVHSYRAVHAGTCYAIDLLVYGSNPEVYSPPATPPFTSKRAFAQMQAVLDTFRFMK